MTDRIDAAFLAACPGFASSARRSRALTTSTSGRDERRRLVDHCPRSVDGADRRIGNRAYAHPGPEHRRRRSEHQGSWISWLAGQALWGGPSRCNGRHRGIWSRRTCDRRTACRISMPAAGLRPIGIPRAGKILALCHDGRFRGCDLQVRLRRTGIAAHRRHATYLQFRDRRTYEAGCTACESRPGIAGR